MLLVFPLRCLLDFPLIDDGENGLGRGSNVGHAGDGEEMGQGSMGREQDSEEVKIYLSRYCLGVIPLPNVLKRGTPQGERVRQMKPLGSHAENERLTC